MRRGIGQRHVCVLIAVLGMSAPPAGALAAEECALQRVSEIKADSSRGNLVITIQIEGHDAHVVLDTGSPLNMISPQLAAELNLPKRRIGSGMVLDSAGHPIDNMVVVHTLGLGGMTAKDVPFLVMGGGGGVDGVFGANFLEAYDLELDLAHDTVNLFLPNKCGREPVYWTQDYDVVPFRIDQSMHPVMEVSLDGHPLTAMLDTGSALTTLSALTARRTFDIDPEADDLADGHLNAGSGAKIPFHLHQFADLEIGGAAFHNTELAIAPNRTNHFIGDRRYGDHTDAEENMATQITIGLRHLLKLRTYFAFKDHKLYISAANAK